ncbi:MAG: glutamate-1-semialdehyde 2,1-aminomutase [Bacteroidetes bacterium]|nr:glutamate-1-semialdehyde 2,1-aminomutase [Bacteroidota bacterium]
MGQLGRSQSARYYKEALGLFPGGVNSPVRAFKSVGGTPLFFNRGKGSRVWDEDGNEFLDFCTSWGPLIHGHAHPYVEEKIIKTLKNGSSFGAPTRLENELAILLKTHLYHVEKFRFVSSGTEAVMSALRLARGYTNKPKILKFEGCYHGHVDSLLVKAGSGLVTLGTSSSAGVPNSIVQETLVLPLNDAALLEQAIQTHAHELAAVIIEPVPANNGLLLQDLSFLHLLRGLCWKHNVLLIFDEVISGFRVAFGGAVELYGIEPDIVTYGKIMGGGLPVGAYGASHNIMSAVSPDGPVYQAGTLSGNPVAMAAGIAQLELCLAPDFYQEMEAKTRGFVERINAYAKVKGYPFELVSLASVFWLSFHGKKSIHRADEIDPDMSAFNRLHDYLLNHGIYLGPSGYEVGFVSSAHSVDELTHAAQVFCRGLDQLYAGAEQ